LKMNEAVDVHERFHEVKRELADKCAADPDFRERLLADPAGTIEAEYEAPAGTFANINFKVVEESDAVYIPIGPDMSDVELDEDQLESVAGGVFFTATAAAWAAVGVAAVAGAGGIVQNSRAGRKW
jgi:hypothetical protein